MTCQMTVTGNFAKLNGSMAIIPPCSGYLPVTLLVEDTRGYMFNLPEQRLAQILRERRLFLPFRLQAGCPRQDA